jgi:hypothetical protein
MINPTGFLDIIIAFATVMLALSLVVKVIQEFIKRMMDRKGEYYLKEAERYLKPHVYQVLDHFRNEMKVAVSGLEAKQLVSLAQTVLDKPKDFDKIKKLIQSDYNTWANETNVEESKKGTDQNIKEFLISHFQQLEKELAGTFDAMLASFRDFYQKRMRYWAVGISFAVVIVLNVDAVMLWQNLSKNQAARLALSSQVPVVVEKFKELEGKAAQKVPEAQKEALADDIKKALGQYHELVDPLQKAEIPFGWTTPFWKNFKYSKEDSSSRLVALARKLLGLFVACALVAAGAPFWHDILESVLSMKKFARRKENQAAVAST